jgi:hypothetical protein
MDTIQDLLPNEHILNFYTGLPTIPEWVKPDGLRLMMGAGDLDHTGIPNVELFYTYDVFFCLPINNGTSLRMNVEYLLAHPQKKLICFLNNNDCSHIEAFTKLFAERFSLIDGHGGHCPHLSLDNIQRLLSEGGRAMNIFERSENIITVAQLDEWILKGYFKNGTDGLITSRIYGSEAGTVAVTERLRLKTRELLDSTNLVSLSDDFLQTFDTLTCSELQYICRSLAFANTMPLNLKGQVILVAKDWRDGPYMEFVIMKKTEMYLDRAFLNDYIERNGHNDLTARADMIISAINVDLTTCVPYARQKYNTLLKHIAKMR